jgi:transposase
MHIETVLRHIESLKGFVIVATVFSKVTPKITVTLRPRKGSRPICSQCMKKAPGYDRLGQRRYAYVPLWRIPVFFLYARRRVDCPRCGVKAEHVPWVTGKSPVSRSYAIFLATWARRLSWKEVTECFPASWNQVYESVKYVVEYGLAHRDLSNVCALGVDEIQFGKGHQYLTLVYQLCGNTRRLLYVARNRTTESLSAFFEGQKEEWCAGIRYVCSDMWKPYLKAIREHLSESTHILDRFHIVKLLGDAIDKVRRQEQKKLRSEGYEDVLNKSKYCFLKNPENLTPKQKPRLAEILQYDLRSVRAYLLKESFQLFWQYKSPYWARWYLRKWCARAMRSRLDPIKKFVGTLRKHEDLIMNWFRARKQFSSGAVEGLNRKVNLITRRAYGYRSFDVLQVALFHTLGKLPEPPVTHRFC